MLQLFKILCLITPVFEVFVGLNLLPVVSADLLMMPDFLVCFVIVTVSLYITILFLVSLWDCAEGEFL